MMFSLKVVLSFVRFLLLHGLIVYGDPARPRVAQMGQGAFRRFASGDVWGVGGLMMEEGN